MVSQQLRTVAPSESVVTVAELKDYLRVDESAEDTRIAVMLEAATSRLEEFCDRKFITQTWEIYFDQFPYSQNDDWWDGVRDGAISMLQGQGEHIYMPFGRLQSLTSFKTYDDDNNEYTFDASNYYVDTVGPFGRVSLKTGGVWPATVLRPTNGIKLTGVFGFGNAASVPPDIKLAVMQFAAIMYEHRGDELPKIPAECMLLLEPYRSIKVGGRC